MTRLQLARVEGIAAHMIRLYQWEISPFCDKVRRVLHVKKQPYEVVEMRLLDSVTGRLRAVNPTGKVPALEHGDRLLGDSTEIAHYLDDAFPEPRLVPLAARDRALVHLLEDWADESLYFYEMHLRLAVPENARTWAPRLTASDPAWLRALSPKLLPHVIGRITGTQGVGRKALADIERDLQRHAAALAALLDDRDWLVGDALSLADIAVFAQLNAIGAVPTGARALAEHASLEAWRERVDRATRP